MKECHVLNKSKKEEINLLKENIVYIFAHQ